MNSLATIWLKTGLMPRWLVVISYLVALGFPAWMLMVSLLILFRSGLINERRAGHD